MRGNRSSENGDHITSRSVYRDNIETADEASSSPGNVAVNDDDDIPILDTRTDAETGNSSYYGRNCQLNLSVLLEGFTGASLEIYIKCSSETAEEEEVTVENHWALIDDGTISLTQSTHLIFKDLPPGEYKVKVADVDGTGTLTILEQHAV